MKVIITKKVTIYTDGACKGNPGPGGWGALLRYNSIEKKISGSERMTTNNRMELTAVIEALKLLKEPCEVKIISDSKYVCDAILKNWLKNWKANNWIKSDKKPVLNKELWEELSDLLSIHNVSFEWIKGHAGHPENELCDKMAVAEAERIISSSKNE